MIALLLSTIVTANDAILSAAASSLIVVNHGLPSRLRKDWRKTLQILILTLLGTARQGWAIIMRLMIFRVLFDQGENTKSASLLLILRVKGGGEAPNELG